MNIKVTLEYRGNEGMVKRGIYPENHPDLLGLDSFLLTAGHAMLTNESTDSLPIEAKPDDNKLQMAIHKGRVKVNEDGNLVANIPNPTANVETPIVSEPLAVDVSEDTEELELKEIIGELESLQAQYKELSGKNASPKWDVDTLSSKIADLLPRD